MSTEFLAVESCTLAFRNPTHTGTFTILPIGGGSQKLFKATCQNKAMYTLMSFTIVGASNGASIINGTGAGVIAGSSEKVSGLAIAPFTIPCRAEDEVDVTIAGFQGSSPATYTTTVYIDDAGQDKVCSL
jgi:hypothetical protein